MSCRHHPNFMFHSNMSASRLSHILDDCGIDEAPAHRNVISSLLHRETVAKKRHRSPNRSKSMM